MMKVLMRLGMALAIPALVVFALFGAIGGRPGDVLPTMAVLPSVTPIMTLVLATNTPESEGVSVAAAATNDAPAATSASGLVTMTPEGDVTMIPIATGEASMRRTAEEIIRFYIGSFVKGDVLTVEFTEGTGEDSSRTLVVGYVIPADRREQSGAEALLLMQALGGVLVYEPVRFGGVMIAMGTSASSTAAILTANANDLMDYVQGKISDIDMLAKMSVSAVPQN